jgi:hypothetical protein
VGETSSARATNETAVSTNPAAQGIAGPSRPASDPPQTPNTTAAAVMISSALAAVTLG